MLLLQAACIVPQILRHYCLDRANRMLITIHAAIFYGEVLRHNQDAHMRLLEVGLQAMRAERERETFFNPEESREPGLATEWKEAAMQT